MRTVRNLSVRVPWHDREWDGHVCNDPLANSSCLALKMIAEKRRDDVESKIAQESFEGLSADQMPPCLRASATFLSPHAHSFQSVMAYANWSRDHAHILPGSVHVPAWGALITPYRWMLKESGFAIAEQLELEAALEKEPENPEWLARTSWIQGLTNQQALLEAFGAPLIEEESLVLFYAVRSPLCDDERRILLGGALLQKKHDLKEYPYQADAPLRTLIWERPIQHTMRLSREGGYVGGFMLPYHALIAESERNASLDLSQFVAFAPDDVREQFSYGSEHVAHGAAAAALTAARAALERASSVINGPWNRYISWIDERLSRLWKLQGPAPGLGVVLSALHKSFNGTLLAMALAEELELNADPWPLVDAVLTGARAVPRGAPAVTSMLRKRWERLRTQPEQLDRLKMLARLELTIAQAERALGFDASAILSNPYSLFEGDRTSVDPISFGTVDRGLCPGKEVATAHPLPASCSPDLAEPDNGKRLRAACVAILEEAAGAGNTFLPIQHLAGAAADLSAVKSIPIDAETIDICRDEFEPIVAVRDRGSSITVQLERYVSIGKVLDRAVQARLSLPAQATSVNWRKLVDTKFGPVDGNDIDEERARTEKAVALERLAGSRIAVLIGPAGTGKTTVLQLLLTQPSIVGPHVTLLAPTGKARVRLGQQTGQRGSSQTVAQFLLGDRFDPNTGRYFINGEAAKAEATTCIVDESSMLTEDMLAAIVDSLSASCRLILVGDPYQLPPIGAGCPFVDVIEYLKREQGGKGVAELTTPRRQDAGGVDRTDVLARSDVQLAAIFSGRPLPPGEDEVAAGAVKGQGDETVKYRQWEKPTDLTSLIESVLSEELGRQEVNLVSALEISLGASKNEKGYLNFERNCSASAENWQILSVNRNGPGGSVFINRRVKDGLRSKRLEVAVKSNQVPPYRDWMRFTKPRGPEQIVYGDKVICVRNHNRPPWIYATGADGEKEFLANGEIGIVTGQRSWGKKNPRFTHVEFNGRGDRNFSFSRSAFSEDGQPYLELAYAITVHKAQGSEFGVVILVLPAQSRLISREMLYTALTRQKRRIWILHQGPFERFLALRQYMFSDIASRFTNLLRTPKLAAPRTEVKAQDHDRTSRGFLEERLIHRTLRGEMVSSKNELVIANILYSLEKQGHITYRVEPRLPFGEAKGRWADFLIEANGQTWYWEHCGMLDDENYRRRWQRKKELYAQNGFHEFSSRNPIGRLIVTEDGPKEGLDSRAIEQLATTLFAPGV